MLSLSATLVRRVVYMKPVPAVDSIRAMTTLMEDKGAARKSVLPDYSYRLASRSHHLKHCTYRALDLAAMMSSDVRWER